MRVTIVRSRFGGVHAELAEMVLAAMRRCDVSTTLVTTDEVVVSAIDVLVLIGAGVEFDEVLTSLDRRANRPEVVLWALDPFPPPDMTREELETGRAAGRRVNRVRWLERTLGGGSLETPMFGRVKVAGRAAAVRIASSSRGSRVSPEHAFMFERLDWLVGAHDAGRIDRVLASSPASVRTLTTLGVPAAYLPVPYDPAMGADRGTTRDLDAVFLGRSRDARATQLASLSRALRSAGIRLEVVDAGCFGEDRIALLNRALVSVNLHKYPWHLERTRLQLSMACGAAVVSELPLADPAPFVAGRHLDAAPFDELDHAIVALVENTTRRQRMVDEAWQLLREGPTMESAATALLAR